MAKYVYLDHHLSKDSIYRISPHRQEITDIDQRYQAISYEAIMEKNTFYSRLRKPDFQRATNAWDPKTCLDFLDSVINNLLIPHTILWASPKSRNIYVLDGAHRISVLQAWMTDDWGDSGSSRDYYIRADTKQIKLAAQEVRELVNKQIGSFKECKTLNNQYNQDQTIAELQMTKRQLALVKFYFRLEDGDGLKIHWATGDYEYAAKSFVRINRGGQHLDGLENFLIENRNNTFIRALMAIAGGKEEGDYWPELAEGVSKAKEQLDVFNTVATQVYQRLFYPSFDVPPTDVHQPLIPITPSHRVHQTLRQVMPILLDGHVALATHSLRTYFEQRYPSIEDSSAIYQSTKILQKIDNNLKHFSSLTNTDNLSLDIVPLFYWYNWRGGFVAAMCYGFIYWILGGEQAFGTEEIRTRKLIFSGNRDRLEYILHTQKQKIANLQILRGGGLKSVTVFAEFFDRMINLLHNNRDVPASDLIESVNNIIAEIRGGKPMSTKVSDSSRRSARNTKIDTQGKILRLFENNHKCPICQGHIDWKRYHQLEHIVPYRTSKKTTPEGTVESHQFCNNNGDIIKEYREGKLNLDLPVEVKFVQISLLDFKEDEWGADSEFPEGDISE